MRGAQVQGRVVVGVDGSESSTQAVGYAAQVARRRGLPLLVVHVTPRRGPEEPIPIAGREVMERFGGSATALVETAAEAARAVLGSDAVTAEVIDDYPVDGLLALSADAALIVTGRRGTGGLPGLLLGSTAGALVQHARCPVITLTDGGLPPGGARRSVVVGVSGMPADDAVLGFAVAEALDRGADLTAVHAWLDVAHDVAVGGFGPLVDWSVVEAAAREQLAATVAGWRSRHPGLRIDESVVVDRAAPALLDASASAELLVVGHRHRGLLARLGSTTNGVLHRASCPVAVVPLLEEFSAS